MMIRFSAAAAVLLAAATTSGAASADGVCSLIVRPWVRMDSATYLTFTATGDSVVAGTQRGTGEWAPGGRDTATVAIRAQVVRLGRVHGRTAPRTGVAPRPGVVVSWGLGSACERLAPHRALGFRPGDRVFLETGTRPVSARARGMPTFDVHASLHRYVPAEYGRRRGEPPLRQPPLSVDEYLRMYQAMPTHRQWEANPEAASRSLDRWARENPGLASREPARSIIRMMHEELRPTRRGKEGRP